MKLIVQYNINDVYAEKEFIGDNPVDLVAEAKKDDLFKQCTSATFEIIEDDDGAQ
jgi:hypothetical protein